MLCEQITPEDFTTQNLDDWVIEPKHDGIRAVISKNKILDRRGKDITAKFPELDVASLNISFDIDGEIIAQSGIFEEISGRIHLKDAFKIKLASKTAPAKFVYFDVLTSQNLQQRRIILESLRDKMPSNFYLCSRWEAKEFNLRWQQILDKQFEGLVAKKKGSSYIYKRSLDWLKIKAFVEVSHKFTKFEEHPKGITIEDDEGRRVVVNGLQANKVKEKFIKEGCVVAQIQHLPQINSTAWRFPSFRGIVEAKNEL
jgi:ATP-dependent DNA ligase